MKLAFIAALLASTVVAGAQEIARPSESTFAPIMQQTPPRATNLDLPRTSTIAPAPANQPDTWFFLPKSQPPTSQH
jgi:hypothetical protein